MTTTEIQSQIDAGQRDIILPAGKVMLDHPINLRGRRFVRIMGQGQAWLNDSSGTEVIPAFGPAGRNWPVIDLTGAYQCELGDFTIQRITTAGMADGNTNDPGCGVLLAREPSRNSSPDHRIRIRINGRFNVACLVNAGSENTILDQCWMQNLSGAPAMLYSSRCTIESPFGDMQRAGISNVRHIIRDCTFRASNAGAACIIALEPDTQDMSFHACQFVAHGPTEAIIRIGGENWPNGRVARVWLHGTYSETWGAKAWLNFAYPGRYSDFELHGRYHAEQLVQGTADRVHRSMAIDDRVTEPKKVQCSGITTKGARCSRETMTTEAEWRCYQHV